MHHIFFGGISCFMFTTPLFGFFSMIGKTIQKVQKLKIRVFKGLFSIWITYQNFIFRHASKHKQFSYQSACYHSNGTQLSFKKSKQMHSVTFILGYHGTTYQVLSGVRLFSSNSIELKNVLSKIDD